MFDKPLDSRSVRTESGPDRLLYVWLDSPGRSVNVFDEEMLLGLESIVAQVRLYPNRYRAIVFRSRKTNNFFAGADVHAIAALAHTEQAERILERGQQLMRQISELPIPTVAVIDGACMGGGLEFALACSHRIAHEQPGTLLALPEIKLGLIPGWGGTQRLPRLIGLKAALQMILRGSPVNVAKGVRLGLVDLAVHGTNWSGCLPKLVDDVIQGRVASRRKKDWRNWLFETWLGRELLRRLTQRQLSDKMGNYPAIGKAIEASVRSLQRGMDGYAYEREAFVELLFSTTARSLLGLFLHRERAKRTATWAETDGEMLPFTDVAVIGAGAMGSGIASLVASKGYGVVLKDITDDFLAAGRGRIEGSLESLVARGRMRPADRDEILDRIQYTTDWDSTADCDLAIEAVVEVEEVKRDVFRQLDQRLGEESVLASNTSSLNVTRLATSTSRRTLVAGLHFFNPVDQMELVEVVRTETTSGETLRRLIEFTRSIGKVPIVTSDKPGFLVNRVLFPYLGEAVRLTASGLDVRQIDREMRDFGMPMGPLELLDQVGIDIAAHVAQSLTAIHDDAREPAEWLMAMSKRNWLGRKSKRGFYVYGNGKKRSVHPELTQLFGKGTAAAGGGTTGSIDLFAPDGLTVIQRRLVYAMLNEAVHCLDEQVVAEAWMVDLGMVLGTGFAPQHGGPLRMIDSMCCRTVHQNLLVLTDQCGPRYRPAHGIEVRSRYQGSFYQSEPAPAAAVELPAPT
jgi:3-hydroxyacyl-CoA dehydrogenase/enoyl-CoA hydratase/carnithine racemase